MLVRSTYSRGRILRNRKSVRFQDFRVLVLFFLFSKFHLYISAPKLACQVNQLSPSMYLHTVQILTAPAGWRKSIPFACQFGALGIGIMQIWKKVPDSRGSQESRNFFQNFNIPLLSAPKSMGSVFTSSSKGLGPGNTEKKISTALVLLCTAPWTVRLNGLTLLG